MELIDKGKVIEEIEKRMQELHPTDTHKMQTGEKVDRDVLMWLNALTWVKGILDSIKTREVDLEKEIDSLWNPRFNLGWDEKSLLSINHEGFSHIARHFFELGLKYKK